MPPEPTAAFARFAARFVLAVTLSASALLAPGPVARALPLFARAANAPCARCHLAAPVLSAAGERWLADGDRPAAVPAHAADGRVQLLIGARFEAGAEYARGDSAGVSRRDGAFRQHVLALDAAADAGGGVSFRAEADLDSAAARVSAPVAYAQLTGHALGGAIALRAGAYDAGLPFVSSARRLTRRDYLAPVAVDAHGLEVAGTHAAWDWAVGQMNSARTGGGSDGRGFNRLEDSYVRLTRALGAQAVGARLVFDRQDSDIPKHAWLQRLRAQVAGRFGTDRWRIVPGWVLDRYDDRPAAGYHQRHQHAMLEAMVVLGADREWTLSGRIEHAHVTAVGTASAADQDLEVARLARELAPGARVALEWSRLAQTGGATRESRLDALVQFAD